MPTWEELFRSGVGDWKSPAPIVLDHLPIFKKHCYKRILDLGCGAGRNLLPFVNEEAGIFGCDLSFTGLKLAKGKLERNMQIPHILNCNIVSIPFKDGSFDAVFSISVINHGTLDEIETTFRQVHRILRQNGQFIFTVISTKNKSFGHGVEIQPRTFITSKGIDSGIVHYFFEPDELFKKLKLFGFAVNSIEPIGKSGINGVSDGHLFVSCSKGG